MVSVAMDSVCGSARLITQNLRSYPFSRRYTNIRLSGTFAGDHNAIQKIGGAFVCDDDGHEDMRDDIYSITPVHGRSAVHVDDFGRYTSIKGSGWSFGGPALYQSPKDSRLVFGLFGQEYAQRELQISKLLEIDDLRSGRVVGWASLDITTTELLHYKDGSLVNQCLLYTRMIYPLRVADLAYLEPGDRLLAIQEASICSGWNYNGPLQFVKNFLFSLAISIDRLHENGGVFDGLSYDNVTLAAEMVDFEWLYVGGVKLPDGSADEMLSDRQRKSGVYLAEIGCKRPASP